MLALKNETITNSIASFAFEEPYLFVSAMVMMYIYICPLCSHLFMSTVRH